MATITLPKRVSAYKTALTSQYGSIASNTANTDVAFTTPTVDSINNSTVTQLDLFANSITALVANTTLLQTQVATLSTSKADKVSPTIDNAILNGNTSLNVVVANNSVGNTGQYLASGGGNTVYWATFAVAGTPSLDAVATVGGTTTKAISISNTFAAGNTTITGTTNISQHTRVGGIAGSTTSGNQTCIEVMNGGSTGDSDVAAISYHCSGYYGIHQHLRADGYFGVGGWSATSWRWYVNMTNGDMTAAGNVTAYSDPRLKEDITPIKSALNIVKSWNGVRYRWKQNSAIGQPGKYDYGILSPDVEKTAPELVVDSVWESEDGDKYKTVAYQKMTPFLIEAIKEQQDIIDQQRVMIDNLQKQIDNIVSQLSDTPPTI